MKINVKENGCKREGKLWNQSNNGKQICKYRMDWINKSKNGTEMINIKVNNPIDIAF